MNCSPTLTAEEFKLIHNAMCDLRALRDYMTGVVHPDFSDKLGLAITDIENGLKGAYDQDADAFDAKHDYFRTMQKEHDFRAVWSMYEVDDLHALHPYTGAHTLSYPTGGVSVPITGPTWLDLYKAADAALIACGDRHYIFVEAFGVHSDGVLVLHTGS